jgi:hypothetical protein
VKSEIEVGAEVDGAASEVDTTNVGAIVGATKWRRNRARRAGKGATCPSAKYAASRPKNRSGVAIADVAADVTRTKPPRES